MSRSVMSKDLHQYINREVIQYGYLVAVKNTRTSKGERMQFGTFLDQEGHFIDTVHFPDVASKYNFSNKGVYKIYGKVIDEFGFLSVEVTEIIRMDLALR